MEKTCFRCHVRKPIDAFYRHPAMKDGHLNKCIDCAKADVAKHYRETIDERRAYERERAQRPGRKAAAIVYQRTRRAKAPEKNRARQMVAAAIREGRLALKPCEVCGTTKKVQSHHDDYAKPLGVQWLCWTHHMEAHGKKAA